MCVPKTDYYCALCLQTTWFIRVSVNLPECSRMAVKKFITSSATVKDEFMFFACMIQTFNVARKK